MDGGLDGWDLGSIMEEVEEVRGGGDGEEEEGRSNRTESSRQSNH